jgi:hypothetical protein
LRSRDSNLIQLGLDTTNPGGAAIEFPAGAGNREFIGITAGKEGSTFIDVETSNGERLAIQVVITPLIVSVASNRLDVASFSNTPVRVRLSAITLEGFSPQDGYQTTRLSREPLRPLNRVSVRSLNSLALRAAQLDDFNSSPNIDLMLVWSGAGEDKLIFSAPDANMVFDYTEVDVSVGPRRILDPPEELLLPEGTRLLLRPFLIAPQRELQFVEVRSSDASVAEVRNARGAVANVFNLQLAGDSANAPLIIARGTIGSTAVLRFTLNSNLGPATVDLPFRIVPSRYSFVEPLQPSSLVRLRLTGVPEQVSNAIVQLSPVSRTSVSFSWSDPARCSPLPVQVVEFGAFDLGAACASAAGQTLTASSGPPLSSNQVSTTRFPPAGAPPRTVSNEQRGNERRITIPVGMQTTFEATSQIRFARRLRSINPARLLLSSNNGVLGSAELETDALPSGGSIFLQAVGEPGPVDLEWESGGVVYMERVLIWPRTLIFAGPETHPHRVF